VVRPPHLYVHVPFCARRCAYCDFAIAVRSRVPVADYVRGVERELAIRFAADEPWMLETLYLGGGTPSRLGAEGIAAVIRAVGSRAALAPDAEVTIEANPDDVSDRSVAGWLESGVNRVSLGVQTFSDEALAWMHRTHDARGAEAAVATLRRAGLTNFSVDLIFALPEHLSRSWSEDLERTVDLGAPHVSLYGLTVEPSTPLARWVARGVATEAPEERYEAEFMLAHQVMTSAGWQHYEVSNFARPGYHARHNSSYWTGRPYAGLGPSAHEFDGRQRRWNTAAYAEWLRRIERGSDPIEGREHLTDANRQAEGVYLGLRTARGLEVSASEIPRVQPWVAAGWATLEQCRLRLTPAGWLRLDALAADLTAFRSR
jgi:oxygen-independent coproporphyrinogen III oxidase